MSLDPSSEPVLSFENISIGFDKGDVLRDISFSVAPQETKVLVGESGTGKTLILKLAAGLLRPDSGTVRLMGHDLGEMSEGELLAFRRQIGFVFQEGALFDSLTVGENVAFPLRERGDMTEEQIFQVVDGLLDMVGVKPMRDLLPSDLSTGMKRSVAIARALAARPECILYDEPTTMVDPLMAQLLGDLIKRLKGQLHLTSIVVTHDMRLAKKLADRIVFLHEAKVLFFGTYEEMEKCQEPIVQEFLQLDELTLTV